MNGGVGGEMDPLTAYTRDYQRLKTVYLLAHVPGLQAQNIVPNKDNQFLSLDIMTKKKENISLVTQANKLYFYFSNSFVL